MLTGDQCVGGDRYVFASDRHQQGAIIACTEGNGLAHGRQLREPAANERELIHVNSLTRAVQRLRISCGRIAWASLSRSEEHTSELQSLMRISYAVFCLKKKNTRT